MTSAPLKRSSKSRTTEDKTAQLRVAAYKKQFEQLTAKLVKLEAENAELKARIKVLEKANPRYAVRSLRNSELVDRILKERRVKKGTKG